MEPKDLTRSLLIVLSPTALHSNAYVLEAAGRPDRKQDELQGPSQLGESQFGRRGVPKVRQDLILIPKSPMAVFPRHHCLRKGALVFQRYSWERREKKQVEQREKDSKRCHSEIKSSGDTVPSLEQTQSLQESCGTLVLHQL